MDDNKIISKSVIDNTLKIIDDDEFELEGDRGNSTFVTHVTAGSLAGLMEHIAIYPIDTIKVNI